MTPAVPVRKLGQQPLSEKMLQYCQEIGRHLRKLPGNLGNHPALLFNPSIEGYRDYTFGGRAGPETNVTNVFHELGHAAQFGADSFRKRVTAEGFVFKVPQVYLMGAYHADPATSQATMREVETFAYQWHLQVAAGLDMDVNIYAQYCAKISTHMHDWFFVPGKGDDERQAFLVNAVLSKIEELPAATALERLEGWLDATAKRLKGKPRRPYHEVAWRFRTDGSLFDPVPA